jgi:hypothetical protein
MPKNMLEMGQSGNIDVSRLSLQVTLVEMLGGLEENTALSCIDPQQ